MKRVLLTGHGGFVGHHVLEYFIEKTDWEIICIDSFRHKGTVRRVVEVPDSPRIKTFKHDLTVPFDFALENLIFDRKFDNKGNVVEKPIDYVFNLASESAVERSTSDPTSCLRNNFELQLNILEFARRAKGLKMFLHMSTDEVYGEASAQEAHEEWAPIVPSNPYAASKAAQEAMAIAYWRTYNMPIVLVNCMNIIGERQDPEKFLPKLVQKIAKDETMPIYGSVGAIGSRIYLHAKNLADALLHLTRWSPSIYKELLAIESDGYGVPVERLRPDRYNVCGDQELDNLQLAQLVAKIMDKELKYELISSESARPGYDRRYALDGSKMEAHGWTPPLTFEQSLEKIVKWTIENPHWMI